MDDLERRVRAANPHSMRRYDPLSERAERELATLLAEPHNRPASHTRRWRAPLFVSTTAAALAVVIVAVAASLLLAPRVAMAAPPLLVSTPITGSTDSVLERLSMNARSAVASPPTDLIAAETWSADITLAPEKLSTFVQPREVTRVRTSDLAGEIVVFASEVRWGSVPAGERPPTPGTELERQTFAAGEFPLLFTQPPPADAAELPAYFATYLGTSETTSAGEFFRAITDLRNEWTLTGPQTTAVIEFIRDLPNVTVAGGVTDRLGRSGVAVSTESRSGGAYRDLLIFAPDTGVLLSAEQIYLGGIPDVRTPASTVLDYTAWKERHT